MNHTHRYLTWVIGAMLLSILISACRGDVEDGDDGDGFGGNGNNGSMTAAEACNHYCDCSFASSDPNCQTTCMAGITMAPDSEACAECTGESSCSDLDNGACESDCTS
jgi:hypothetical protein